MESWTKFATKVSRPARWQKMCRLLGGDAAKATPSPLNWAVPAVVLNGDVQPTIDRWHRSICQQKKLKLTAAEVIRTAQQLTVGGASQLRTDGETALLAVATAQALPAIAAKCDEGEWRDSLDSLVGMSVSPRSDWELMPWGYQLVSVELPLTLAYLLPEFDTMEQTGQAAAARLNDSLSAMLDLDGWPAPEYLPLFAPLVASWTRCLKLARKAGFPGDPAVDEQIQWLVPQVFRMMRHDGSLMLSDFRDSPIDKVFASQLAGLMKGKPRDRKFTEVCRKRKPKTSDVEAVPLEESSLSEWASSGVLQSRWARRSTKLAIDFSGQECQIEFGRDLPLIGGQTMPEIRQKDQPLTPVGDFEVVCHEQNEHLDFVELEIQLSGDARMQRQIVLSRTDEFLILADVVLSPDAGQIKYHCDWPLAPNISSLNESETRELYLTSDNKICSLVLPLALPEWKAARFDGQLVATPQCLSLKQASSGTSLYAPLLIDLNPKRSKRPRTWRHLTVAEHLNIVPDDVAVAFRIQLDQKQWILYRSLAENGNRTFMGENFAGEFFLGSFSTHGQVTPLLQIE